MGMVGGWEMGMVAPISGLTTVIADCVGLARMILEKVLR